MIQFERFSEIRRVDQRRRARANAILSPLNGISSPPPPRAIVLYLHPIIPATAYYFRFLITLFQ